MSNHQEPLQNQPICLSQIPEVQTVSYLPLDKNYPLLSLLSVLVSWTLVLTPLLIAANFTHGFYLPFPVQIGLVIFALLMCAFSYYAAKLCGYRLREKDILYRQGLFWKKRTGVSFKRIQHMDINQGPLERRFSLATIKFFTAGGSHADLKITGLQLATLETIRQHILQQTGIEKTVDEDLKNEKR